ncbi:MAG: xanthine dehydrogenase family protein molybdopterin-binding subunit, partial [Alphaproteobacteria bacterium]
MKLNKGNWVGQAVRRKEDFALLTGHARFMDDLEPVVGLRHAAVLRSPHGHAELVSLDISRAAALPGVVGVLTGKDVVAMGKPIGNLFTDKAPYYPCAVDRVRYYGEPVAVVIAEDRYVAEDALDLIDVVYKPMPAVIDPEAALAADAPVLHDKLGTNKVHHRLFRYGDPEHAFSEAEHVARVKVRYPRVNSTPIETYGVVAHFEPVPDRYTVWSNFQGPFAMHAVLCDALRTPTSRVRMITAPASGGSFGIKQAIYPYIVLMALASRRFGVPVKWIEDRLEHLAASSASSERVTEIEGAFRRDGTLLALRLKQTENVGAYLRPPEPAGLYRMHATLNSAYKVQHFAIENTAVVTNQMPSGLNRGFGAPQYIYPLERLLDVAASDLGLNGETIRRQNFIPKSRMPYECPAGSVIDGGDYQAALDLALDTIDIKDIMLRRDRARANGRLYGIGIACAIETSGSNLAYVNLGQTPVEREQGLPKSGAAAVAVLRMDPLGNITVHIDSTPSGQGHETMVAQVVADTLGVTPDDVDVITPMDTGSFPWTVNAGNYSNRFTACVVPAVKLAADRAAHKLRVIAQREFDMPLDKIKFRKGKVYVRGARNFEMPIRRLAAQLHWDSGNLPDGMDAGLSEQVVFSPNKYPAPDNTDRVRSSLNYAFQVDVAAGEIDRDSGEVRIDKYATVHESGKQLNPK